MLKFSNFQMFPTPQNGNQNQQNVDLQKHCILVAASNPYPLQTPVYVPRLQNSDQVETIESEAGNCLHDAEAVAKAFPQVFLWFPPPLKKTWFPCPHCSLIIGM